MTIKKGTRFYTPDFKVTENNGTYAWHEVKGYMDATSRVKLQRFAKYYPNEKLILIDAPAYRAIAKKMKYLVLNWE